MSHPGNGMHNWREFLGNRKRLTDIKLVVVEFGISSIQQKNGQKKAWQLVTRLYSYIHI